MYAHYIARDPTMLRAARPTPEPTISFIWLKTWTRGQQPVYHHHGPWRDHLFHDRPTYASSR